MLRHFDTRNPVGEVLGHVLLEHRRGIDVRLVSLHRKTAFAYVRQHKKRNPPIIVDHLTFRDSVAWKNDPILTRNTNDMSPDTYIFQRLSGRHGLRNLSNLAESF